MKSFLQLNKSKLVFAFRILGSVFIILVLIIFGLGYLNGQVPTLSLFLMVSFGAGIAMPLLILVFATLRGVWEQQKRRKAFNHPPFHELHKHGFRLHLRHEFNRWKFTELSLLGQIDGFQILAEVDTQHAPDIIRFQAMTEVQPLGRDEVRRLNKKFSPHSIELDFEGVTKTISIKSNRTQSINDLLKELAQFIQIIREEGFQPTHDAAREF